MGVIETQEASVCRFDLEAGHTVAQILEQAQVGPGLLPFVVVKINDREIDPEDFDITLTRQEDEVGIYVRPAGGGDGKAILRLVAIVAIAIAAPIAAGALNGTLGLATTVTSAAGVTTLTTTGIAVTAGIAAVGSLIVNALIPPPSINIPNSSYDTGESYFITSQSNTARPYQPVPIVYGKTKIVANLASQPEIFSAGDSTLITSLLDFGLGDLGVFNIRAGDTKIQFFNATKIDHTYVPDFAEANNPAGGLAPVALQLLQYPLKSQELSVGLNSDGDFGIASTVSTAYSAVVELYFPQGIAYYDKNGNLQTLGVTFKGEYKEAGTSEWLPWPSGTEGYAGDRTQGDHIWFGQGLVGPGDPNPPENPSVQISVPTRVDSGDTFVLTMTFNQAVYQVEQSDFRFIRAGDTSDQTSQFTLISSNEITANRVWQYQFRALNVPDDQNRTFYITTNLQEFTDAPPPDGLPFPETSYQSNSFQVVGESSVIDPDPDPDPDPPPEENTDLFDLTPGNETYVFIVGFVGEFGPYEPGNLDSFNWTNFGVFVGGVAQTTNTSNPLDYAGIYQTYSQSPGFGGYVTTEYWSLKNADGSAGRVGGAGGGRFYPGFPDINPGVFGSTFSLYGNEVKPAKASIVIQFPVQGEYEVRVTRVGDTENSDDKNQYFNASYWSRLASRGYPFTDIEDGRRSILNLRRKHTMMELRLEASERVQGNLNQISATVISRLRGHNGTQWTEPTNSSDPAWIVADLLTGYHAQQIRYPYDLQDCPGYLTADKLNLASFREFSRVCRQQVEYEWKGETLTRQRYQINMVLSSDAPLIETVQNILGQCRAQLVLDNSGKLAIMMDEDRGDQVRQLFTPANSWGFNASREFPDLPHGLIVEFVSPELGYQKGEIKVYRPGYDFNNATRFETLKTFGVTNWHMAAQYGMYAFGQMVLRQETFTLTVAAESLTVQRGDVVEIAQDAAALGGGVHLVVDHNGGDTFTLSEEPNDYDDAHYTIKTREGVYQGDVLGRVGRTVQLDRNFAQVYANENAVIVIGEKDLVTKKYIINSIRPKVDMSAELTLLPYDARVYNTDDGEFPEWTPGGDGDPQNPENGGNARTENLQGFTYLEYNQRLPISVSSLTWELQTADAQLSGWKVQWTQAGQDTRIDIDELPADRRAYEHKYQSNTNEFGPGTYTVTPIMQLGYVGQGASVFVGRSVDRIAPPPPRKFRVVAEPNWTKAFWERPDAPDIGGYQIYSLTKVDNDYQNITENDFNYLETKLIAVVDWDETYHYEPYPFSAAGACFWITCTDTSGNVSDPAYFDGLENGVPKPGLVEPFDIVKDGQSRLEWLDLVDPNNLIGLYELRFASDENQAEVWPSEYMGYVAPTTNPDRKNQFLLGPGGWPDIGAWYIRARDAFGNYGPWNRTSTAEIDYQIEIVNHYQEMFYVDRMPFTKAYTEWSLVGAAASEVTSVRGWLYPRQAEGKNLYDHEWLASDEDLSQFLPRERFEGMNPNGPDGRNGPWLLWETTDPEVIQNGIGWFEISQLPRGDIYHQGQIIIEGLVDGVSVGTEKGVQEWQIEYDNIGPPAPEPLTVTQDGESEVRIQWFLPDAEDNDFVEIRYARRIDMEWEEAELIERIEWEEAFPFPDPDSDGFFLWINAEDRPGKYMVRYTDTSGNPGGIAEETFDAGGIDTDGWTLIQSIQGHIEWNGVLDGLERREGVSAIFMTIGLTEAFFYYDETSDIPNLGETRIISETLEAYGSQQDPWDTISDWPLLSDVENMAQTGGGVSNLEIYHEVQLPGSEFWQEFTDSAFPITGEVKYRIRLVNLTPEEEIGIEQSRILVYAKEEPNP